MKFQIAITLVALAAFFAASGGATAQPEAETYIVVLTANADLDEVVRDHTRRIGAEVVHIYGHALNGYAAELTRGELARVRRDGRVSYVSPDRKITVAGQVVPTGVQRIGADGRDGSPLSNTRGLGVHVAIIDSGIDLTHPDLRGVVPGRNCVARAGLPHDDNGHGSHVAGTIAARDDDQGVVGVAPEVTLHAVKALDRSGTGSMSGVICGVDWVTANAAVIRVVNLSLGTYSTVTRSNPDCTNANRDALHTAICRSVKAGITYVAAAGNDARNAAAFVPAAYEEVIAVSALSDSDGRPGAVGRPPECRTAERDDHFAAFSNFGAVVDIAAPGVCILSTWKNGTYVTASGTSVAAPHVTGAAARYISANPTATPDAVRSALLAAQEPGPIPGDADSYPEGVVRVATQTTFPTVPLPPVPSLPTVPAVADAPAVAPTAPEPSLTPAPPPLPPIP